MAKATKTTAVVSRETNDWVETVYNPVGGITVRGADLTNAAIVYGLTYGLKQSLNDCIAGPVAKARQEGKTNEEIAALVSELQADRFAAIQAGTVGHRTGGPRVSPVESVMRKVALEDIRVAAQRKGVKLPKGEALANLVSAYVAKDTDGSIRDRAEARMAESAKAGESAGDMLGELGL